MFDKCNKQKTSREQTKLYKNLKSKKLLKIYTKETSIVTDCKIVNKVVKSFLDMEMHKIQGLPALFFDNFQKTLENI